MANDQNGHAPDAPGQGETGVAVSANGPGDTQVTERRSGQPGPSVGDVFAMPSFGAKQDSALKEFSTFPKDPAEYYPRSIVTERQRAALMRFRMQYNRRYKGFSDVLSVVEWQGLALGVALHGRGRRDLRDVAIAETRRKEQRGIFGGLFNRFRDAERQETQGAP